MGRLIDIDVLFDYFGNDAIDETTRSNIEYFVSEKGTVEAIPKSDYKNRLKADLVAMLDKLRAEIKKWYWQADKQALAKDPCVVDAMIDLFIRTIDKYKADVEQESEKEK